MIGYITGPAVEMNRDNGAGSGCHRSLGRVALDINTLQDDFYQQLVTEYTWKRDRICSVLDKIGLTPAVPQGAYYVLADISRLHGLTSKEKAMHLLNRTGVAGVPGGVISFISCNP